MVEDRAEKRACELGGTTIPQATGKNLGSGMLEITQGFEVSLLDQEGRYALLWG